MPCLLTLSSRSTYTITTASTLGLVKAYGLSSLKSKTLSSYIHALRRTYRFGTSTLYGAVAAALGYNISLRLSGKLAFTENAAQRANSVIIEARVAHANQTDDRYEVIPEWIAVRGYDYTPPAQRFIYPYGPLIGMDNIARNSSNS